MDSNCLVEPYKVLGTKVLPISNSLVQPKNVILSLINITRKPIHVKQHTLVGSLTPEVNVEEFQSDEKNGNVKAISCNSQFPKHLQELTDDASDKLTDEQQESLRTLLVGYQSVFMGPYGKLGRNDLVKHTIDTVHAKSIKNPPRTVPQKQKEIIEQEINSMLENDTEPSTSPGLLPFR